MAWAVSIALLDHTDKTVSLQISKSKTSRASAQLECFSDDGSWTPAVGNAVEITYDSNQKFVGTIDRIVTRWLDGRDRLDHSISCTSYEQIAARRIVTSNEHYERQPAGDIITAIATSFLGGENLTVTTDAGPDVGPWDLQQGRTVEDALDEVCALAGMYWDMAGSPGLPELRALVRGSLTSPVAIDATTGEALAEVEVTKTRQGFANRVFVAIRNGAGTPTAHDQFGDGTTREFALPQPASVVSAVLVNGITQTFAILDSGTTAAYYWAPESATITQDAGETILTGSDLLSVEYQPVADILVLGAEDTASISARAAVESSSGKSEVVISAQDGALIAAATEAGEAYLAAHKVLPETVRIITRAGGFFADIDIAQEIDIDLPAVGINGTYWIENIEMRTSAELDSSGDALPEYTWQASLGQEGTSDWRALWSAGGGTAGVVGVNSGLQAENWTARYAPPGAPPEGTDVANNHYQVEVQASQQITLTRAFARAKTAPTTDLVADWQVSTDDGATWDTIFTSTTLEIAAATLTLTKLSPTNHDDRSNNRTHRTDYLSR